MEPQVSNLASEYHLRWEEYTNNLKRSLFGDLTKAGEFTDVTLICEEEQISAHKVVLSASSEFFKNVLQKNKHEHPLMYMRGVSMNNLRSILNFMYTGETVIAKVNLMDVMAIAKELKIKGLAEQFGDEKTKMIPLKGREAEEEGMVESEEKDEEGNCVKKRLRLMPTPIYDESFEASLVATGETVNCVIKTEGGTDNSPDMEELKQKVDELCSSFNDPMTGKTVWQCMQCEYSHKQKSVLKDHVERHIGGYSHSCNFCAKTFNTRNSLRVHKIRSHSANSCDKRIKKERKPRKTAAEMEGSQAQMVQAVVKQVQQSLLKSLEGSPSEPPTEQPQDKNMYLEMETKETEKPEKLPTVSHTQPQPEPQTFTTVPSTVPASSFQQTLPPTYTQPTSTLHPYPHPAQTFQFPYPAPQTFQLPPYTAQFNFK